MRKPEILVFAGPNGSGKSTITQNVEIIGEYINADDIKKELNCSDLEAAQKATTLRENYVLENKDNGVLKARMVLKEETLIKWIEIVETFPKAKTKTIRRKLK